MQARPGSAGLTSLAGLPPGQASGLRFLEVEPCSDIRMGGGGGPQEKIELPRPAFAGLLKQPALVTLSFGDTELWE